MRNFKKFFKKMSQQENDPMNENEQTGEQNETVSAETEQNTTAHAFSGNEQEQKISALEQKVAEANDKYLRLYSEFDNFRKRTQKERIELLKTAGEETIKSLLPVIDDFERAIRNSEKATDIAAIHEGVKLIHHKFQHILSQKGLEAIESTGKAFDTDLHEAITNIPAPSEDLKGKVVEEVEKGYLLNGKVIRFAKVVVGN